MSEATLTRRRGGDTNWIQALGILPVLLLIGLLFSVMTPNFATPENLLNIMRQASINIVLATGMTFVILTGGIDLSVGSILGTTAVVALVVSVTPGLGWAALPVALFAGLVLGLINGVLVAYVGLSPFIVTLGSYTTVRGLAYLFANGTSIINNDLGFAWIGNDYFGPLPWLVWIAIAVVGIAWFILRRTVLGVRVYAVGGNEQAARLTGIKVGGILLFVYAFSGLLAGLAGVMSASRLYSANGTLGTGYELDAIAAVVLGGTSLTGGVGSVLGTLIGALIIAVLNNGLTILNVSFFWQLVIKGVVIIVAVTVDRLRTRGARR
jgi:ribose transport system permease protein